jgi:ribonuclease Z
LHLSFESFLGQTTIIADSRPRGRAGLRQATPRRGKETSMRSTLIILAVLLAAAMPGAAPPGAANDDLQVILLGTGYPRPDPERAGASTAVIVKGKVFVVDAGRGVVLRLAATEFPLRAIHGVFLTHLHSDHTAGLPDLFNTSWIFRRYSPLELYGPKGTRAMARSLKRYFAEDIRIRRDLTEMHPGAGATIRAHEIREGVVYQDSGVRVTAFLVDHPPVRPAFGYRFDAAGKSVVISGDTRPSENLIRHARGADLLIHEAYLPEHFDRADSPEVAARLKHYHSTPEEAGRVATAAGVKKLVLTHLIPGDADAIFLERARKRFSGEIVIGRDLMRF